MLEILCYIGLQNAGFLSAPGAPTIDKLFRDVSDLGDVEMLWNSLAARQDELRPGGRMCAEKSAKLTKFHAESIYS